MPPLTQYPNSLDGFSRRTDLVDIVKAVDPNELQAAVEAIENTLGTNPHGTAGTVRNRLDNLSSSDGNTSSPQQIDVNSGNATINSGGEATFKKVTVNASSANAIVVNQTNVAAENTGVKATLNGAGLVNIGTYNIISGATSQNYGGYFDVSGTVSSTGLLAYASGTGANNIGADLEVGGNASDSNYGTFINVSGNVGSAIYGLYADVNGNTFPAVSYGAYYNLEHSTTWSVGNYILLPKSPTMDVFGYYVSDNGVGNQGGTTKTGFIIDGFRNTGAGDMYGYTVSNTVVQTGSGNIFGYYYNAIQNGVGDNKGAYINIAGTSPGANRGIEINAAAQNAYGVLATVTDGGYGSVANAFSAVMTGGGTTKHAFEATMSGGGANNGLYLSITGGTGPNIGVNSQVTSGATGDIGIYSYIGGASYTVTKAFYAWQYSTGVLNYGYYGTINGAGTNNTGALLIVNNATNNNIGYQTTVTGGTTAYGFSSNVTGATSNYDLYCVSASSFIKAPYRLTGPTDSVDNGSFAVANISGQSFLYIRTGGGWEFIPTVSTTEFKWGKSMLLMGG